MINHRKINDRELIEHFNAGMTGKAIAILFGCSAAAVSKRLKRLNPGTPKAIDSLTPQRAAMVKRIASGESATNAVEQTHNTGSRKAAQAMATKIMALPSVQLAIQEELERAGLSRQTRIAKLADFVENADPGIGLKALKMSCEMGSDFPDKTVKSHNLTWTPFEVDLSRFGLCSPIKKTEHEDATLVQVAERQREAAYNPLLSVDRVPGEYNPFGD